MNFHESWSEALRHKETNQIIGEAYEISRLETPLANYNVSTRVPPYVKYLKCDLNPFPLYWECMPLLTQCCLQGKRRNKEFALVCWSKTVCPEQIFYVYLSVCKPLWVSMLWLYTCMKYCNTLGSRLAFLNTFPHYFFLKLCKDVGKIYISNENSFAAWHKKSIFFYSWTPRLFKSIITYRLRSQTF